MNLHQHQKHLQKLLHDGYKMGGKEKKRRDQTYNTGMYVLSQNEKSKFFKMGVSYGNTGGLYGRLKDYKICHNRFDEWWL